MLLFEIVSHLKSAILLSAGLNRYTVFAPTDAAMAAIPATEKSKILQDSIFAKSINTYYC